MAKTHFVQGSLRSTRCKAPHLHSCCSSSWTDPVAQRSPLAPAASNSDPWVGHVHQLKKRCLFRSSQQLTFQMIYCNRREMDNSTSSHAKILPSSGHAAGFASLPGDSTVPFELLPRAAFNSLVFENPILCWPKKWSNYDPEHHVFACWY